MVQQSTHPTAPAYMKDLSPLQRRLLQDHLPTRLFALVSWGCAATTWIAKVLNSHPDVFCAHAANISWMHFGGPNSRRLDGLDYLLLLAEMGNGYIAAGDVHGISRDCIPHLRASFGESFSAAVLVRDPLPRLNSQMALFRRYKDFSVWDLSYTDEIIRSKGILLPQKDEEHKMFVHAANMLNAILQEKDLGTVYRMEDLVSSPDVLCCLAEELTGGQVSLNIDWATHALATGKINRHSLAPQPSPEDWQIDVLRRVVDAGAWDSYKALGYAVPSLV